MRIGLIAGDTTHWLAGNPASIQRVHSWASGFAITPASEMQIVRYIDAAHGKPIDRRGLTNQIRFSTSRTFASAADAELFALDLDTVHPRAGIMLFEAVFADASVSRRQMADTVVSPAERRVQGATLHLDYRAAGGAITPYTPPEP